jgi:hypothetical protein
MLLQMLLVEEVPDPVFSTKMVGKGTAMQSEFANLFLKLIHIFKPLFLINQQFTNPISLGFLPLFLHSLKIPLNYRQMATL